MVGLQQVQNDELFDGEPGNGRMEIDQQHIAVESDQEVLEVNGHNDLIIICWML